MDVGTILEACHRDMRSDNNHYLHLSFHGPAPAQTAYVTAIPSRRQEAQQAAAAEAEEAEAEAAAEAAVEELEAVMAEVAALAEAEAEAAAAEIAAAEAEAARLVQEGDAMMVYVDMRRALEAHGDFMVAQMVAKRHRMCPAVAVSLVHVWFGSLFVRVFSSAKRLGDFRGMRWSIVPFEKCRGMCREQIFPTLVSSLACGCTWSKSRNA